MTLVLMGRHLSGRAGREWCKAQFPRFVFTELAEDWSGFVVADCGGDRALSMAGSRDPADCRFLPDEGDVARSCRRTCAVIVGWMTTHLRRLTIPGQDPAALARFWGGVLLRPVIDGSDGLHLQMVEGNEPQALATATGAGNGGLRSGH
ncbi:hypothetical protein [Streptomyces sp. NPDC055299]